MKFKQIAILMLLTSCVWLSVPIRGATASELNSDACDAIKILYSKNAKAREIANQASAMLVFPTVIKGGFILGGHGGDGVLLSNGRALGYYHTSSISYGLQAGVQKYGYVLFFMNHHAMNYLNRSGGWEVGTGPSLVVVDTGTAKTYSTTTMNDDIYAFIFNQKGLMAGLGLQGTKITKYTPDE
jgi:lipid-binding SYLF domain-containing protein